MKVPGGTANAALEALCRRLASGEIQAKAPTPARSASGAPAKPLGRAIAFPAHEPGQSVRFGFAVLGWTLRSLGVQLSRLPRWIRYVLVIWLMIALWPHGHANRREIADAATDRKLDDVAAQYQKDPKNLAKLGATVAKEFADSVEEDNTVSLLAMPFTAPAGDAEASRLAESAFAQTYTRISVTHHGAPIAGDSSVAQCEPMTLAARGRAKHARYVLCGSVGSAAGAPPSLAVTLIDVKGARGIWRALYPVAGSDAAKIAQDIAAQIPKSASDD